MVSFLSIFITSFVWIFIAAATFILYAISKRNFYKKHFIDVCLRKWSGGQPTIDIVPCYIHRSKKYGEFLYNKKRKLIIRRFDQEAFLPSRKGRMFLDLTASDGYYYMNKYGLIDKILSKPISARDSSSTEYQVKWDNKEDMQKDLADKYKLNEYTNFAGIVNMTPHEDRASFQQTDSIINQLNKESLPWHQNPTIVFLSVLAIGSILVIVIVVLAMQHSETIISQGSDKVTGIVGKAVESVSNGAPSP